MTPRSDLALAEIVADWRKRRKRWRLDPGPVPATAPTPTGKVQPQRGKRPGGSSQYRGVFWDKACRRWKASVRWQYKLHHCGTFTLEVDAAHAYDRKAREVIGPGALTNFPDPDPRGVQF